MKILVTGGAGFIASHIVDRYIQLGHTVSVVDNLSSGKKEFIHKSATFYEADIRDRKKIKDIISRESPEVINHHAAQISVRESVANPQLDAEVNILGLINILDAASGEKVKKVIFASSGGVVYGDSNVLPTPESYQPLLPISPYGVSKLASEQYLHYFYKNFGMAYIALRYANVYGPRQNPHGEAGVVAIFNLKFLHQLPPVINGDGKQTRDYVYVGDVVSANVAALTSPFVGSVNIATARETDVNSLASKIQSLYSSKIVPSHKPEKEGEQKRSCLDNSFAKNAFGWEPKVDLEKGLLQTKEYFQKHEKRK